MMLFLCQEKYINDLIKNEKFLQLLDIGDFFIKKNNTNLYE